jgi:hypothetical protein
VYSTDCQKVGIDDDLSSQNTITLYPNPSTSQLNIKSEGLSIKNISIVDLTGRTVKMVNNKSKIIDISDLEKGTYFLRLHTDNGMVSRKFLKN